MSEAAVEESTSRFACPRCGAFSHHVRGALLMVAKSGQATFGRSFSDKPGVYFIEGTAINLPGSTPPTQWTATVCAACNQASVWREDALVYPAASTAARPHPEMPSAARGLYEEASAVLPHSRRAAAALARAALESLLKELDESGGHKNLQTRIGELQGKVNASLWQVLTALRVVGNDSLHGDEDDLVILYLEGDAAEVVEPFFGAINALVEELITQPRKAQELYALIPQAKRDAAERAAN